MKKIFKFIYMRKIFLISILVILCTVSFAQFFDMRSSWSIIETNLFDDSYGVVRTYNIEGDTIINDLTYGKLFCDNVYYCSLRESGGRVFAKFQEIETDLLVYDFNWSPNDTLFHQVSYDLDSLYVQAILGESIDSVLLMDGRYYKCLKNFLGEITIISGIGDTHGFFYSTFELPTNGSKFSMIRFSIGGVLVYCNSEYDNCGEGDVNEITTNDLAFNVFPNPANQVVTIEFYHDCFKKIEVYDTKGIVVYSRFMYNGMNHIDLDELSKGEYIIVVSNSDNKLSAKLIVK